MNPDRAAALIRQHSAGFEEWKPVTALDTLTVTMAGAVSTPTIRRLA